MKNKKRKIVQEEFYLCNFDSYFATFVYFLFCLFGFSWRGEKKWLSNEEIKILRIYGRKHIFSVVCMSSARWKPGWISYGCLSLPHFCITNWGLWTYLEARISNFKLITSSMCSRTGITSLPSIQKSYTKHLCAWHTLMMLHTSSQQGTIFFWTSWRGDTILLLLLCSRPKILASELFRHLERRERIKNMH